MTDHSAPRGDAPKRPDGRDPAPGPDPRETTVHDALSEIPGARDVFARFGIDACCGGELPLAVAADHHGVELDRLLDALAEAGTGESGARR